MKQAPFRVMVVDDSVVHRQTIVEMLREIEGVEVVGRAIDGQEALRTVALVEPDLITLDLEMPRMDGFTFLRLLMATRPTSVLVVSSFANVENVFRALECGAVDFVARPTGGDVQSMRAALREKVVALKSNHSHPRPSMFAPAGKADATQPLRALSPHAVPRAGSDEAKRVFVVASSTGGPPAIVDLIQRLPANFPHAVVVAQHMPERFTRSFADRLARKSPLRVSEAEDGTRLLAGSVCILPGNKSSELALEAGSLVVRVGPLDPSDRYSPSADRVFTSAAVLGPRCIGVVLTGMGDDGAIGAAEVLRRGGELWVEAAETAVVDGMPAAARRIGPTLVLPLGALLARIAAHDVRPG
ncbi:MAG: chemotaxis-specific protein-glutamate methyltransferase CheB [Polyangiales bacterium]